MDNQEARELLEQELKKYRERSYPELKALLNDVETREVLGASGTTYQLEIQAMWDDKPEGDLRIMGSIDDGGLRAFVPLTDSFIIAESGEFVGE